MGNAAIRGRLFGTVQGNTPKKDSAKEEPKPEQKKEESESANHDVPSHSEDKLESEKLEPGSTEVKSTDKDPEKPDSSIKPRNDSQEESTNAHQKSEEEEEEEDDNVIPSLPTETRQRSSSLEKPVTPTKPGNSNSKLRSASTPVEDQAKSPRKQTNAQNTSQLGPLKKLSLRSTSESKLPFLGVKDNPLMRQSAPLLKDKTISNAERVQLKLRVVENKELLEVTVNTDVTIEKLLESTPRHLLPKFWKPNKLSQNGTVLHVHRVPPEKIRVTEGQNSFNPLSLSINTRTTFSKYYNHYYKMLQPKEKRRLKVSIVDENTLGFGKGCTVQFQRTLRVPTSSEYQYKTNFDTDSLPVFDNLPFLKVSAYANKLPEQWVKQNGIIVPMHMFEGCKLSFEADAGSPVAVSIQVDETTDGITGQQWADTLTSTPKPNYIACPPSQLLSSYLKGSVSLQLCPPREWNGTVTGLQLLLQVHPMMRDDVTVSHAPEANTPDYDLFATPKKYSLKEAEIIYMQSNSLHNPRVLGKLSDYHFDPQEEILLEGIFLGKIPVIVKLPTGKRTFYVNNEFSVLQLKKIIENMEGIDALRQRLFHKNAELKDEVSISEYKIQPEDILVMGFRHSTVSKRADRIRGPQQWDRVGSSRLYVYIVNNSVYEYLTGKPLEPSPIQREDFAKSKVPWLDSYKETKRPAKVITSAPVPEKTEEADELETVEMPSEPKANRRFSDEPLPSPREVPTTPVKRTSGDELETEVLPDEDKIEKPADEEIEKPLKQPSERSLKPLQSSSSKKLTEIAKPPPKVEPIKPVEEKKPEAIISDEEDDEYEYVTDEVLEKEENALKRPTPVPLIPIKQIEPLTKTASIDNGSKFTGEHVTETASFPVTLVVSKSDGKQFEGELHRSDSKSKINGHIEGNTIIFDEKEYIEGSSEVTLPIAFKGNLQGTSIAGTTKSRFGEQGTFKFRATDSLTILRSKADIKKGPPVPKNAPLPLPSTPSKDQKNEKTFKPIQETEKINENGKEAPLPNINKDEENEWDDEEEEEDEDEEDEVAEIKETTAQKLPESNDTKDTAVSNKPKIERKDEDDDEDEDDYDFSPPPKPVEQVKKPVAKDKTLSAPKTEALKAVSTPTTPANSRPPSPSPQRPASAVSIDCPKITGGTIWIGEVVMDGETNAVTLTVGIRRGKTFDGNMVWNAIDAKTKVQGNISGNSIDFVEKDVLKGADLVTVPMIYKGTNTGANIVGTLQNKLGDQGTFKLDLDSPFQRFLREQKLKENAPKPEPKPEVKKPEPEAEDEDEEDEDEEEDA